MQLYTKRKMKTLNEVYASFGKAFSWDYEKNDLESWNNPEDAPPQSEIDKKITELNKNKYQRDRASAYPSWQDQMELLYHGGVDALKAELKKVKDKYPKP